MSKTTVIFVQGIASNDSVGGASLTISEILDDDKNLGRPEDKLYSLTVRVGSKQYFLKNKAKSFQMMKSYLDKIAIPLQNNEKVNFEDESVWTKAWLPF